MSNNRINPLHPQIQSLPRATVEHTHGSQLHLFGNAVGATADDASHMGSMPIAILSVAACEIECNRCSATKLRVRRKNTGVEHVYRDTRARFVIVVRATERQSPLINAIKPPRRVRLAGIGRANRRARSHCFNPLDGFYYAYCRIPA